jgi:hypothetical protein
MSHQVNFYLDSQDLVDMEAAYTSLGPVAFLSDVSPTSAPLRVPSLIREVEGKPWLFFVLARPEDLGEIVMSPPAHGRWSIDILKSPVVEFSRSFEGDGVIRRGRIYYTKGFYGSDGKWVDKPAEFLAWASVLTRRTKRGLTRHDGDYIGKGAERRLREGKVKLVAL